MMNEGTDNNRFEIVFKKAEKTTETILNNVLVYSNSNTILFNSPSKINSIEIYDALGRLLFNKVNVNKTNFEINSLLKSNNILLVKVIDENNTETKRKILF